MGKDVIGGKGIGEWMVANWKYPEGTLVSVELDDGTVKETRTRSMPWLVGDSCPVILLEGITGGYALSRVTVNP